MNTRKAWILYIVLRLLFLAVPFAVLYLIGWPAWLAIVTAALIAVSLSLIFLSKSRDAASTSIYEWRHRDRTPDDIVEDAAVDAAHALEAVEDPQAPLTATSDAAGAGAEPEQRPSRAEG